MRKSVEVGQRWKVRLHGRFTIVRITNLYIAHGIKRSVWRADAINEMTGRAVTIRSAAKLRELIP